VVAGEQRHLLDALVLARDDVGQRLGQRLVGREGAEQVLVALVVDLRGGGRRRHRRDAVLLGDAARRLGGARAERREQEVDLVLGDQPLGRLYGARRVGGVVHEDDLDLVGLAAGLDAAPGVGGLGPQVVAILLADALGRERARQRQR